MTNGAESNIINWKTIPHFSKYEFECKCGGLYCDPSIIPHEANYFYMAWFVLSHIRAKIGSSMIIHRGYSCPRWNKHVGGRKRSYHTLPDNPTAFHPCAVDFRFNHDKDLVQDIVLDLCNRNKIGYHLYSNWKGWFIHLDFRNWKGVWK